MALERALPVPSTGFWVREGATQGEVESLLVARFRPSWALNSGARVWGSLRGIGVGSAGCWTVSMPKGLRSGAKT